jgi:hypothetical protein
MPFDSWPLNSCAIMCGRAAFVHSCGPAARRESAREESTDTMPHKPASSLSRSIAAHAWAIARGPARSNQCTVDVGSVRFAKSITYRVPMLTATAAPELRMIVTGTGHRTHAERTSSGAGEQKFARTMHAGNLPRLSATGRIQWSREQGGQDQAHERDGDHVGGVEAALAR